MIKIEHSIFALPFAWFGLFAAQDTFPSLLTFIVFSLAMVCGRSFAMGINRILDVKIDTENPRTLMRPLVTGEITKKQALIFSLSMGVGLLIFSALLNIKCVILAIIILCLSVLYSYAKRFTFLCHFILGLILGLSPVAGWLATGTELTLTPILIGLGVMFWVAGFDIIYACQDFEFDLKQGLNSFPVKYGLNTALTFAGFFHINTIIFFLLSGLALNLNFYWYLIMATVSGLLIWQHKLVSHTNLSKVNIAFFYINAIISPLILLGFILCSP
ncbi:4-hydroxybenzoate polyprenyltransferase [Desulfovibrio litoralis DSM 11393]|uniref:4-hydroxybenzoate polyprenyltransferase n=2 Tax=Desulfovibrio litoralis TaxID=466107 RepID=A0A1M7SD64_9BACT|nr:4-hydroxybenzoate polyprenyltransferase [Desulfovibrio litoralis DSM 11393]